MKGETKRERKLDQQQWEQVRAFVQEFFDQQPEKASKAAYRSLFKEIQERYPCIILSESSFKKHVAPIEKLRADAGIQGEVEISRKYCETVSEIFHGILIDLPLDEFESIGLEGLIQRADQLYPDLQVTDKKRKTLAQHFPIKNRKARAREQRPGDAPVAQTVQTHEPADPGQALGPAAADIDGQRLVECQGQPDYQSARYTIVHLSCMNFTFFATETPLLPQRHYSPYPISCAAISCSKYRKMTINNYRCSS